MKHLFLIAFVVLLGLSGFAYYIAPRPDASGKKQIVWATDDNPRRRGQVALFNELHPDYDLRIDPINSGLDKIVTQSLAGVGPDVFDGFADQIGLLYDAGLLLDVTDDLAQRGITLDQIWPLARPVVSIDGRLYGVPFNSGGDALWYHKDLFDEAGLPYPPASGLTWGEFVAIAQKLTKRDAAGRVERYGVMGLQFRDVMYVSGGRYLSPDGRRCVVDAPQNIEALQRWLELQNTYKVMPNPAEEQALGTQGGFGSGITSYFQEKRCAMGVGGRWWLSTLRDVKDADGQFPYRLGVTERPVISTRRFIGAGSPRVTFVNAKGKHKDRALEFLLFECGTEFGDQLNRDADNLPGLIERSAPGSTFYTYAPNGDHDAGNSEVWKTVLAYSITTELSPYITPRELDDILNGYISLTTGPRPSETPTSALTKAARAVNDRIARNTDHTAYLRKKFNDGDARPYMGNKPWEYRADERVTGAPR